MKFSAVSVIGYLAQHGTTGWENREAGAGSRLPKLEFLLPDFIPPVIELMRDSKPEVASAAETALLALAKLCTNPETVKLREHLLAAIIDPNKTEETLVCFSCLVVSCRLFFSLTFSSPPTYFLADCVYEAHLRERA